MTAIKSLDAIQQSKMPIQTSSNLFIHLVFSGAMTLATIVLHEAGLSIQEISGSGKFNSHCQGERYIPPKGA